ncbi:MAG: ribosome small subunit-dependent GTPase A [Pseudobdellovibrio sp.]
MNSIQKTGFRVIFESREQYRLMDEAENIYGGEISGAYRNSLQEWPAVGDWVEGRRQKGEYEDWILIEELKERKSLIARSENSAKGRQVLAANVDTMFVVTSANHEFNLNRIERYLALSTQKTIQQVIVLNKIELCPQPVAFVNSLKERFPCIPVCAVSVVEKLNLESLQRYLQAGSTVTFVGSSGVGKSSLTNYLLGYEKLHTSEIREADSRGRHTTTHRELILTPGKAAIIDTPGLRSVGVSDEAEVDSLFADIESCFAICKFTNCRHTTEPGCEIQHRLNNGELSEERWQSYCHLQREVAFERRKTDKLLRSQEKKKWAKKSSDAKKLKWT